MEKSLSASIQNEMKDLDKDWSFEDLDYRMKVRENVFNRLKKLEDLVKHQGNDIKHLQNEMRNKDSVITQLKQRIKDLEGKRP